MTESVLPLIRCCILLEVIHALIVEGHGDEDAADVVRDMMDEPWKKLTAEEIELTKQYSEKLYADQTVVPEMRQ